MINLIDGEHTYDRYERLSNEISYIWRGKCAACEKKPHENNHHVEGRGKAGRADTVSNVIPMCLDCHNMIHAGGKLRTSRFLNKNTVTFVFEHIEWPTRKIISIEEKILRLTDKWERIK